LGPGPPRGSPAASLAAALPPTARHARRHPAAPPGVHTVAAWSTCGCSMMYLRLQPGDAGSPCSSGSGALALRSRHAYMAPAMLTMAMPTLRAAYCVRTTAMLTMAMPTLRAAHCLRTTALRLCLLCLRLQQRTLTLAQYDHVERSEGAHRPLGIAAQLQTPDGQLGRKPRGASHRHAHGATAHGDHAAEGDQLPAW
jgi:hypothetical protein